jgi:hypothetical protein
MRENAWLQRVLRIAPEQWLKVVLFSLLVLVLGWKLLFHLTELLIHTLAFQFSESYREHVKPFGGYEGYITTQLVPRWWHSLTAGWRLSLLFRSVLLGVGAFLVLCLFDNKPTRVVWLLVLFVLDAGLRYGRMFVIDPFWAVIYTLFLLICFMFLVFLMNKYIVSRLRRAE